MQGVIYELLIAQIVLILVLLVVIYYLIKARHNLAIDKKFNKYTISPLISKDISIFDKIVNNINKSINKIAIFLRRLKVFDNYAKKYNKHIPYSEIDERDEMYYIALKLIIGFSTSILYIVTMVFQYVNITIIGLILSFLLGFFLVDLVLQIDYKKRQKEVREDLLKAIIIMNNSFKSGMSIMQAIEIVKNELEGYLGDEFKKIYLDLSYGLTIETVFNRFYERVNIEEVKFITTSLSLLNRTGGNIVKVFKSIEREFYDKKKLDQELNTVTASSNFVYKILLIVPFVICIFIFILNSTYFNPLFQTKIGFLVLFLVVLLYISYILIIKRVLKVRV